MSIEKDYSFSPSSNALEPHRPQHDCPTACVIAQQYSATTFVLLHIHFSQEKSGALLKKMLFFLLLIFRPSWEVSAC
jgi:hypothetical protein